MPEAIEIANCDENVCRVHRGEQPIAEITIKLNRSITHIDATAHLLFATKWWKMNIGGQAAACDYLIVGKCPAAPGDTITFRGKLKIPRIARPGMSAQAKLQGLDQDNNVLTCVKVLGKIIP